MEQATVTEISCGILQNPKCLTRAQSLLYSSYVKELGWQINPQNPSNIQVIEQDNRLLLVDDYDDCSTWFAIYHHHTMMACARLCHDDANGLLEIERYENARKALEPILRQKQTLNLVELNREAIIPLVCGHKPYYALKVLKAVFQHCIAHEQSILTTCNIKEWVALYDLIGWQPIPDYTFKYCQSEPAPVSVYLATPSELIELTSAISDCLSGLSPRPKNMPLIASV
ncbi:hypothetical protein Lbir_0106 [Legionella birminghamensis]|uniref:Acyl-homoserine-lactone synthase n=1 Tax=Legionella birminghamensis TaxID=28083 RepID=A0A378I7U4_9GAMM|nr:hypothetical protein [Legionella birminghamensis]KTC76037.1 hypothetical protein Lbir_0106 [Legionella birminghamensis]STX30800.1 Uncharacterised protein [Legionella birminghamensis]